jgi:hypothetical protein
MPAPMAIEIKMTTPVARKSVDARCHLSFISRSRECWQDLLCREKLKFARELKRPATDPGLPDADAETTYGIKSLPSNNTDEACPNDETRLPDINNIRSPSIIPCALC